MSLPNCSTVRWSEMVTAPEVAGTVTSAILMYPEGVAGAEGDARARPHLESDVDGREDAEAFLGAALAIATIPITPAGVPLLVAALAVVPAWVVRRRIERAEAAT